MSMYDRVFKGHSCGGMNSYAGEWHKEVPSYEESSVRVTQIDLRGQYHVGII